MEADGKESTQSARGVFIKKKGIEGDEWQTVQSGTKGFPPLSAEALELNLFARVHVVTYLCNICKLGFDKELDPSRNSARICYSLHFKAQQSIMSDTPPSAQPMQVR